MILSPEPPDEQDMEDEKFLSTYQEASDLYGLIHSRFITSPKGLAMMREKFLMGAFGQCPRIICEKQNVLPIGLTDELKVARVKVYCPKCEEVYAPKWKCQDIDGGYFGLSFPQLLLMTYPDIVPVVSKEHFIPKIYGFKIFKKAGSRFKEDNQNEKDQGLVKDLQEKMANKVKNKKPNSG